MSKIWFVTGGTGFVGRNLIRSLRREKITVRALSRSEIGDQTLLGLGAHPVRGDLDSLHQMTTAMTGCDVVVHAAAKVDEWGPKTDYERINVIGTANVLTAARNAEVRRLIHIGTEAPFAIGQPVVRIDESVPLPPNPLPRYPASKASAEHLVISANQHGLETIILRPRLIWGNDDTSLLPQLIGAVNAGRFMWIGGGNHLTSSCHVDNLCEAIRLASRHGTTGRPYFVTDGDPIQVREFLTRLLATQGVQIPDRSVPRIVAWSLARAAEALWDAMRIDRPPPASRVAVALLGVEVTVNDQQGRQDLNYRPVISVSQGLDRMAHVKL